ncbi:hypothetical protein [Janthinobacterium sp. EB271-G4-7A]|uniref:hypothetical protein n=1 Tax=Janthinobacterium sp. EB271-G4-7A TaxID=2775056 RepID=UPI001E639E64|nr:hypothetical protein [Janthinobacterium sp. EB271-G4-7A]MCC7695209.1 hypothetical protein [Janthinobacterium sp. EB271-G4-7A]
MEIDTVITDGDDRYGRWMPRYTSDCRAGPADGSAGKPGPMQRNNMPSDCQADGKESELTSKTMIWSELA